jgi:hypothetical protein
MVCRKPRAILELHHRDAEHCLQGLERGTALYESIYKTLRNGSEQPHPVLAKFKWYVLLRRTLLPRFLVYASVCSRLDEVDALYPQK